MNDPLMPEHTAPVTVTTTLQGYTESLRRAEEKGAADARSTVLNLSAEVARLQAMHGLQWKTAAAMEALEKALADLGA